MGRSDGIENGEKFGERSATPKHKRLIRIPRKRKQIFLYRTGRSFSLVLLRARARQTWTVRLPTARLGGSSKYGPHAPNETGTCGFPKESPADSGLLPIRLYVFLPIFQIFYILVQIQN